MRITFVIPGANLSGGIRVVSIYAEHLKRRGHRVLALSRRFPPNLRQCVRLLLRSRVPIHRKLPPSHLDGADVEHRIVEGCHPLADADVPDADVIVATWWETAEWVVQLSARKGAKAYLIQHHEVHVGQPVERVEATWRLPFHKITVSKWLADLARERYGDHEVSIVPNAVDHEQFDAPPRGKQSQPTVGMIYSATPFKRCDLILRGFEKASRRLRGLRLIAFGEEAPSKDLPLPPGTHYVKRPLQSQLRDLYSQCDVWLVCSRSEGFGLPILESMACRTPVIATPTGIAPEVVPNGGGVLVRHDDPSDIADAIEAFATIPVQQWRGMSDAAYATASRYSWQDSTTRFESALRRAIERSAGGDLFSEVPVPSGRE